MVVFLYTASGLQGSRVGQRDYKLLQCSKKGGGRGRISERLGRGRYGKSETCFKRAGVIVIVNACC